MRRLYLDLALRRLARGDLRFPLRALRGLWAARRGTERPLLGTLVATYRCDLRCSMCDLPRRGDRSRELGTEAMCGVLDGMADLGVVGVGITGGEPLLRPDLEAILAHGTRRGLLLHVNTNGSLVTGKTAAAFARSGVASVNLSLDGPDAATHDRLRGRAGSFASVLRAAARLCALADRPYRVALTCALGTGNVGSARALVERARDLGVDRIGFLPVHDLRTQRVAPLDPGPREELRALADLAGRDLLLDNSRAYLEMFRAAYAGEPNPLPCTAPRTSVVVDCYGAVFPCVPLHAARQEVGRGDVRRVWRSHTYREAREALRGCRRCFWNCHSEMNVALSRLGAAG